MPVLLAILLFLLAGCGPGVCVNTAICDPGTPGTFVHQFNTGVVITNVSDP